MKFFSLIQNLIAVLAIAFCASFAHAQEVAPAADNAAVEATATSETVEQAAPETASAADATAHMDAQPWQLGMRPAASPVQERIFTFHHYMLILITVVSIFVLALMIYVCIRFSEKNNPTPSKTSHNTMIEVIWTLVPVLILLAVVVPSFRLLYFMDKSEIEGQADMTLKIVGYQWYWNYEYPDAGFSFDSYLVREPDLKEGELRLLTVDNPVVVPVGKKIRVQMTGGDVIHSWAMPNFGVKMDAVPGHLNETWFQADKIGTYYGQCSELCGRDHGFMPIVVHVVSEEDYEAWLAQAKDKFAAIDHAPRHYAALR